MCTVVNKYRINLDDPDVVYIGRGSDWGNPYSHISEGTKALFRVSTRDEAISSYKAHLWTQIQNGIVTLDNLRSLHGKRLACFCAPKSCHGDVIVKAVEWAMKTHG